jgi:hypothetical protein
MMNGKFHLAWGDFGSLRNLAALEYECSRAVASGADICVGDQLHPSGVLEADAYRRIGRVFSQMEATEKWGGETKSFRHQFPIHSLRTFSHLQNGEARQESPRSRLASFGTPCYIVSNEGGKEVGR